MESNSLLKKGVARSRARQEAVFSRRLSTLPDGRGSVNRVFQQAANLQELEFEGMFSVEETDGFDEPAGEE